MKKLSIITLICGVVLVLSSVSVAMLVTLTANTSPIGIIGGADIPTTKLIIYSILNGWPIYILVSGTVLIIAAVFCLFFGKTVEKHCSPKTTILALATSFCGAAGLSCL